MHGLKLVDTAEAATVSLPEPALSAQQLDAPATWTEPRALNSATTLHDDSIRPEAITQHAVPNCSLVAGLIVCYEHHRRFGSNVRLAAPRLAHSQLHLRCFVDTSAAEAACKSTGTIGIALHVNGKTRHLGLYPGERGADVSAISPRLPVDAKGALMTCKAGKGLWAPLVEKAARLRHSAQLIGQFMTVMGGYDFRGSCANTPRTCANDAASPARTCSARTRHPRALSSPQTAHRQDP